ncbi:hypothetical protein MMC26_002235 [Xylographa opegraphella]|nr:hypothetical protein [Xylographa opegraphella]
MFSDEPTTNSDLVQQHSSARSPVQESTSSENTLRLASHWLSNCLQNHQCGESSSTETVQEWRPSRLIDVGDLVCGDLLRLCESADIPSGSLYVSLSHCWGKLEIFKLTTKNFESLKNRVPPEKLTQTFLDAIEVTRRLGIRYVWIDSLCILQDSPEDWNREAALMGKVYKYSYCNIAATGVWDGRRGFFSKRIPALIEPLVLQFPEAVQKEKVRRTTRNRFQRAKYPEPQTTYSDVHTFLDLELWKNGVEDAPLNSRGWVVQERVLAPRVLHFGFKQLYWECRALEACETFPNGFPNVLTGHPYKSLHPFDPALQPVDPSASMLRWSGTTTTAFHVWDRVVAAYTSGALSRSTDKLVAISGIARELHPLMNSRYLAGLWEAQLPRQLLWVTARSPIGRKNSGTVGHQSIPYRAPSWSWAATDGPLKTVIQWDWGGERKQRDFLIDILAAHVTPAAHNDAMGQVVSGSLIIRGRMLEAHLVEKETMESSGPLLSYQLLMAGQTLIHVSVFEDIQKALPADDEVRKQIFCVPVSVSVSLPRSTLDERTLVYGLLVERVAGTAAGNIFRRVGVFMSPTGSVFLMSTEEACRELVQNSEGNSGHEAKVSRENFDWKRCTQWHGDGGKMFGDAVFILV